MRRFVRHLPSPPMAVALLALFVALGGSAYAINNIKAPKNSVVAKSIKRGAVTRSKLAKDAVNSAKVAPGSLGAGDIDVASLGIPKATKYVVRTESRNLNLASNQGSQLIVECKPGEVAVGGGGRASDSRVLLVESFPFVDPTHQGWLSLSINRDPAPVEVQVAAYVICAST